MTRSCVLPKELFEVMIGDGAIAPGVPVIPARHGMVQTELSPGMALWCCRRAEREAPSPRQKVLLALADVIRMTLRS